MQAATILSIVTDFVGKETDRKLARTATQAILDFCRETKANVTKAVTGTFPEFTTTGLPEWVGGVVTIITSELKSMKDETTIGAFLSPFENELVTAIHALDQEITAKEQAPDAVPSFGALGGKLKALVEMLAVVPDTAHPNVSPIRRVVNQMTDLIKTAADEIAAIEKKA